VIHTYVSQISSKLSKFMSNLSHESYWCMSSNDISPDNIQYVHHKKVTCIVPVYIDMLQTFCCH